MAAVAVVIERGESVGQATGSGTPAQVEVGWDSPWSDTASRG